MSHLDLFVKGKTYYFLTISPKDWFTAPQRKVVYEWFSQFDQVLGYTEVANRKHLHVLFSSTIKKTFNVTRLITKLFTDHQIPFEPHVTIKLLRSSHPIGTLHYLTHPDKGGTRVLLKGWQMSWIQQTCRDNVKLIPKKLLQKDVRVLSNVDGPALIIKYAETHHMPLTCKRSFIEVVTRMSGDKYRFHATKKKDLLADTLAECGHDRCARLVWESEFRFIED